MSLLQDVHERLVWPSLSHRFIATFFWNYIPLPTDYAFTRITGLSNKLDVKPFYQGGDNTGVVNLPDRVSHGNITFHEGVRRLSVLKESLYNSLEDFDMSYLTVVVIMLDEYSLPEASWTFSDVLPVGWTTSDLNASGNEVLLNTLEFSYGEMLRIGLKA